MMQKIAGMVSLSLDAWTSSNGYAFLAIVMHYVDDNWESRTSSFYALIQSILTELFRGASYRFP